MCAAVLWRTRLLNEARYLQLRPFSPFDPMPWMTLTSLEEPHCFGLQLVVCCSPGELLALRTQSPMRPSNVPSLTFAPFSRADRPSWAALFTPAQGT